MKKDFVDAQTIQKLVEESRYMVLSTVDDAGNPHTSPVFYQFGPGGCFYWLSTMDAAHSRNILRNGRVSGVIMDTSHRQGTGYALYFMGRAELFHKPAHDTYWGYDYHFGHAVRQLCAASETLKDKTDTILHPLSPRKMFRLRVMESSINGAEFDVCSNLWIDRRRPVNVAMEEIARGMGSLRITQ